MPLFFVKSSPELWANTVQRENNWHRDSEWISQKRPRRNLAVNSRTRGAPKNSRACFRSNGGRYVWCVHKWKNPNKLSQLLEKEVGRRKEAKEQKAHVALSSRKRCSVFWSSVQMKAAKREPINCLCTAGSSDWERPTDYYVRGYSCVRLEFKYTELSPA